MYVFVDVDQGVCTILVNILMESSPGDHHNISSAYLKEDSSVEILTFFLSLVGDS